MMTKNEIKALEEMDSFTLGASRHYMPKTIQSLVKLGYARPKYNSISYHPTFVITKEGRDALRENRE